MKEKDILRMLDQEVDKVMPDKMPENITATPIKVSRERKSTATARQPKKSFVRSRAFQGICACLVCVAVLVGVLVPILANNDGGGAGNVVPGGGSYQGSTYLSMDINPSVDFVVDKDGKVKNVISQNNDGDVLLSRGFRESLIGLDVSMVVNMTIDQATKLGYIDAGLVPTATSSSVNAVRLTIAGDDSDKAGELLARAKTSAVDHLKSKNIFMVVVDKLATKEEILGSSGVSSIEKWNESIENKNAYHYVNNVIGKDREEVLDTFKRDFVAHHVADALDEAFEDIDDGLMLIGNIKELEDELESVQRENKEGLFDHIESYWQLMNDYDNITNEDVKSVVDDITETIEEYNEIVLEDDDESIITVSKFLKHINLEDRTLGSLALTKMKGVYDVYMVADLKDSIDALIDDIEDNLDELDAFLDRINTAFGKVVDDIADVTERIKTKVNSEIDKVSSEAEEYYNICKAEIERTYDKLVARHEGAVGAVTPEEYDRMMSELLDKYDDLDDFWDATHPNK